MKSFRSWRSVVSFGLAIGVLAGSTWGQDCGRPGGAEKSSYYSLWLGLYSGSSSGANVVNGTGTSCMLCHRDSNGGDPWNAYGWKIREIFLSGGTVSQAIAAAEPFDSDGNGDSNLVEINADSQPGWTAGPNNTIFFKSGSTQAGQNPPAGILGSYDPPSCGSVVSYCTAGTSTSGCQASLSASGTPSATAASGFSLMSSLVEGNKDGLFFFGTNGRQANAWGNGTSYQCVVPPVKRAGLLVGTGTNGACDGSFSQDLNALWQAQPAKNPGAGAVVQAQLWYRDPLNTSNQTTSLSSAVEFVVCP